MTIPASGPLSLSRIAQECGQTATSNFDLNGTKARSLFDNNVYSGGENVKQQVGPEVGLYNTGTFYGKGFDTTYATNSRSWVGTAPYSFCTIGVTSGGTVSPGNNKGNITAFWTNDGGNGSALSWMECYVEPVSGSASLFTELSALNTWLDLSSTRTYRYTFPTPGTYTAVFNVYLKYTNGYYGSTLKMQHNYYEILVV